MYQSTIKNKDQSGIGAEYVKTASFFIRTSFSFAKNSLKNHSGPGCKRHGHPDVGEVQTRISMDSRLRWREVYLPCQRHFYALFLHLIRWKRAFFQITSFLGDGCFAKFRRCAESILFPRLTRDRIKTGPIKIRLIRSVLLRPRIKCGDKEILTHRQFPLIRRGSLGWQFLVRLPYTNKKIDTKNKFSVYLLSISYGILIGRFLNRELGNLRISPSRDLCRIRIECQRIFYTITYNLLTGCRFFSFQHGV